MKENMKLTVEERLEKLTAQVERLAIMNAQIIDLMEERHGRRGDAEAVMEANEAALFLKMTINALQRSDAPRHEYTDKLTGKTKTFYVKTELVNYIKNL